MGKKKSKQSSNPRLLSRIKSKVRKKYYTSEERRAGLEAQQKAYELQCQSDSKYLNDSLEAVEADYAATKQDRIERLIRLREEIAKQMTPQQLIAVKEYFRDFNGTRALMEAGYSRSTAVSQGIFRYETVKRYVSLTKKINEISIGVTAEFVLEEFVKLAKISISDLYDEDGNIIPPHLLAPNVAAAVSEIKERSWTEGEGKSAKLVKEVTYKLYSKLVALDALGRHVGLFEKDNRQKAQPVLTQFILPHNGRNSELADNYNIPVKSE